MMTKIALVFAYIAPSISFLLMNEYDIARVSLPIILSLGLSLAAGWMLLKDKLREFDKFMDLKALPETVSKKVAFELFGQSVLLPRSMIFVPTPASLLIATRKHGETLRAGLSAHSGPYVWLTLAALAVIGIAASGDFGYLWGRVQALVPLKIMQVGLIGVASFVVVICSCLTVAVWFASKRR